MNKIKRCAKCGRKLTVTEVEYYETTCTVCEGELEEMSKRNHKHSRYPGQPEWIDKEFPMYRDMHKGTWWDIRSMYREMKNIYINNHGNLHIGSPDDLTPIYGDMIYEPSWNTVVAFWNDEWDGVVFTIYSTAMVHQGPVAGTVYRCAIVPKHILDERNPPTSVAVWQRFLKEGRVEELELP